MLIELQPWGEILPKQHSYFMHLTFFKMIVLQCSNLSTILCCTQLGAGQRAFKIAAFAWYNTYDKSCFKRQMNQLKTLEHKNKIATSEAFLTNCDLQVQVHN